jgi:hypothetical protein
MRSANKFLVTALAVLIPMHAANAADPLPGSSLPANLGVAAHYKTPQRIPAYNAATFDSIAQAGISLVRFLPDWQSIETTRGNYDFSYPDWLIEQFASRGIRPVIALGLNNPLYGVNTRINTEEQRQAFAAFVRAMARRYKGRQFIWEVWNEPNIPSFWKPKPGETLSRTDAITEYLALLDAVIPVLREEDPGALIIGPAASNYNTTWLQQALSRNLLANLDGLSVHPYQAEKPPELVIAQHAQVRGWIPAPQRDKPVFFTEWGYSTGVGPQEVSLARQADYVQRMTLLALMLGIRGNFVYSLTDASTDASSAEPCTRANACYGLFTRYSGQPKPAFDALRSLATQLSGYSYVARTVISSSPSVYVLTFQNSAGNVKYAVWDSQTETPVAVPLPDGQQTEATQTVKIISKQ